jgi:chloramphenicol 3-O phosphotransferase
MEKQGNPDRGKIILLNGASSSGKSTLARALQAALPLPFWTYSIDNLRAANVLPHDRIKSSEFHWPTLRPAFFEGFHNSIPAFASAGNNLIVEHIIEQAEWMTSLQQLLDGFDVFFVGVHCPLPELERREVERGDRRIGEAKLDFETTHQFCSYDVEVESTVPSEENARLLIEQWHLRSLPSAFFGNAHYQS